MRRERVLHTRRTGVALLAGLGLLVGGCGISYLTHVSFGQAGILWNREPIDEVLARPDLDPHVREQLELVGEARAYAAGLGLTPGDSYRAYTQLDREWTSLALSAARKDALEPHLFWFPIVGRLPYKGYFERERATAAQQELVEQGLDTYLRPVDAFSTLGWFDDPVLSPMLKRTPTSLVDTILHEATHATVYWSEDVDLSEGFATFVGWQGSRDFAVEHFGAESTEVLELDRRTRDRAGLVALLAEVFEDLDEYFEDPKTSSDAKIEGREQRFDDWKKRIAERAEAQQASYGWLAERDWNNAFLLSLRRYLFDVHEIEALHRGLGGELPDTIAFFKGLASEADPSARLTEKLESFAAKAGETEI